MAPALPRTKLSCRCPDCRRLIELTGAVIKGAPHTLAKFQAKCACGWQWNETRPRCGVWTVATLVRECQKLATAFAVSGAIRFIKREGTRS